MKQIFNRIHLKNIILESDIIHCFLFLKILFFNIDFNFVLVTFILLFLLFILATTSTIEYVFLSIKSNDIKNRYNINNTKQQQILKLLSKPERLHLSLVFINNFALVTFIIVSTLGFNLFINFSDSYILKFIINILIITIVILIFGYIIPNLYSTTRTNYFSSFIIYSLLLITKILSPLSYIFVKSDDLINKRNSKVINNQNISVENLTNAISQANSDLNDETDFVTGIVNYWNINAREIMKPRVNVIAAEIKYDFEKLMAIIVETSYSRIPVYEDTFDNIKGVLYIKDLLPYINSNIDFEWRKLIRKPYFVPENKRINVLLEKFQKNKIHMAIVIDEYAGVLGIVTLEDVFEEIIGEIAKESNYTKIEENTYLFDGNILLNDFYKSLDIQDDIFEKIRGDADSLAGLILEIKGKIPLKGAIVEFENFTFTVTSVDSRKIKKVKLKINKI